MIPGLKYLEKWLSSEEETELLAHINNSEWETSLKRRVQQYGPVYNYTTKKLNKAPWKEIPSWIKDVFYSRLMDINYFDEEPAQLIINEYEPGQGITRHIDSPIFGDTIASLSLLSDATMDIGQYEKEEISFILARRSLMVFRGEARYNWYHCIPPVSEKRISITFRTLKQ